MHCSDYNNNYRSREKNEDKLEPDGKHVSVSSKISIVIQNNFYKYKEVNC